MFLMIPTLSALSGPGQESNDFQPGPTMVLHDVKIGNFTHMPEGIHNSHKKECWAIRMDGYQNGTILVRPEVAMWIFEMIDGQGTLLNFADSQ